MTHRPASPSRIFRNLGFLTVGKVVGDLSTFLLFVVISRVYGHEGIGRYSLAMALTGFFAIFGDFGMYNLSITELSRRRPPFAGYLGELLSLRIVLSTAGFAALVAVHPFLPVPAEARNVILLIGAYQFLYRLFNGFTAVFVAEERMGVAAALEGALRVAITAGGSAVALLGGGLSGAVMVLPLATLAALALAFVLVARSHGAPRLTASVPALIATARRAVSYFLSSVLFQFSARVDVLLLGLILGEAAAGVYNVPYRIVHLLSFSYYYASISVLPAASRLFVGSRSEMSGLYRVALRLILLTAVPAAAGLTLVAPDLIRLVFGDGFSRSAGILKWLAWLLVLAGLKHAVGTMLMAGDRQLQRVKGQWLAAGLNVVGNLILIPWIGLYGAVIATLASESLLVVLLFSQARGLLGPSGIGSRIAISVAASTCFFVPFSMFGPFPLAVVLPSSILIYLAVLLAFRDVRRTELAMLLRRFEAPGVGPGRS